VIVDWLTHRTPNGPSRKSAGGSFPVVLPWVQVPARVFLLCLITHPQQTTFLSSIAVSLHTSAPVKDSVRTSGPASNLYGSQVECSACSARQPGASDSNCTLPQPTMTAGSGRGGVSPSSSPRLPSPPPFTEVQIGPKSPTIGDSNNNTQLGDALRADDGALRRIRPGTKASEMASGPPMVEIHEVRMAVSCSHNQYSSCH
jgi:hypothetical protein